MIKFAFLLLLLSQHCTLFSQSLRKEKVDSLIARVNVSKDDIQKAYLLLKLANHYKYNNLEQAIYYSNEAIALGERLHIDSIKAEGLMTRAFTQYSFGNLDNAIVSCDEAESVVNKMQSKKQYVRLHRIYSQVFTGKADYDKAVEHALRSLHMAETTGDSLQLMSIYNQLGVLMDYQNDLVKSEYYYQEGMVIAEQLHQNDMKSSLLMNMGIIRRKQNRFDEALACYSEALQISIKRNSLTTVGEAYLNMAAVYGSQEKYQQGIDTLKKAIEIWEKVGNKRGLQVAWMNLGSYYTLSGQPEKGEEALNKSLELVLEIGNKDDKVTLYQMYNECYEKEGDLKKANEYLHKELVLRDSIYNEDKANAIAEMQTKYETEKKDKEITLLSLENEKKENELVLSNKQRRIAELNFENEQQQHQIIASENELNKQSLLLAENTRRQQQDSISNLSTQKILMTQLADSEHSKRNWSTAGGAGFAILLSLVFYQVNRRRKTKHSLQINQLNNKVLRTQLNPHFIFNALNSIRNYIQQHADLADSYLTKFSTLMRQVLENSEEERITLQEEIAMLENYMELESIRLPHGFDFEISIDDHLDAANTMIPPMILQPMVENAIWHGLKPLDRKGKITLRFTELKGMIEAVIEDDGIGVRSNTVRSITAEKKRSMGMQITRERIDLINRKSKLKGWLKQKLSEQGSQVRLALPV